MMDFNTQALVDWNLKIMCAAILMVKELVNTRELLFNVYVMDWIPSTTSFCYRSKHSDWSRIEYNGDHHSVDGTVPVSSSTSGRSLFKISAQCGGEYKVTHYEAGC